ncbi:hypothetical protein, partial [Desulfosarcina sp.]|uniref:hypothetical protein n=1 Tax=Desulfosarcina sp. TaxID=2027861 RepID=UPI00356395BD
MNPAAGLEHGLPRSNWVNRWHGDGWGRLWPGGAQASDPFPLSESPTKTEAKGNLFFSERSVVSGGFFRWRISSIEMVLAMIQNDGIPDYSALGQ